MPSERRTLPELPYAYDALEPAISGKIMELHHKKHHAAYIAKYNDALEKYEVAKGDLATQLALLQQIKFNGGGDVNHSLFWPSLAPKKDGGGTLLEGSASLKAIEATFGSFDRFKELFSSKAVALQGSGWVWLGLNPQTKGLEIASCDNQDPLSTKGLIPLFGIDVWEHAYYLQYENVRPDYVKAIWSVINWKTVDSRFTKAMS